jgi:hypothetical protein
MTVRYCATSVQVRDVERCIAEIPIEQQRRRNETTRLTYREGLLRRRDFVSGSGQRYGTVEDYEHRDGRIVKVLRSSSNGLPLGFETFSPDGSIAHNFDERGRPTPYRNRGSANIKRQFDAAGFVVSTAYLDVNGNAVAADGVHEVREKRNVQGAQLEISYFDEKGQPKKGWIGTHRSIDEVDGLGLTHGQKCFDEQSRPALCRGAHEMRIRYDDAGNAIQYEFFGIDKHPTRDESWGAASLRISRDERGNDIEMRLFDEHGQPTAGKAGYASRKAAYDARDRQLEYAFFDVNGAPTKSPGGAAIHRWVYDARGNPVTTRYFDESGAPTLNAKGAFHVENEWDARDNLITTRYRNVADELVSIKEGYAIQKRIYDGDRMTSYELFDENEKPTVGSNGYARAELSYDADGGRKPWRYLDLAGKEVERPSGDCYGSVGDAWESELHARRRSINTCYQALLSKGQKLVGKLVIVFEVDIQGKVSRAKVTENEPGSASLAQCVLDNIRKPYTHGANDGCAAIKVPFNFKAQ